MTSPIAVAQQDMVRVLFIANDIKNGIPSYYHSELEERLPIAWRVQTLQRTSGKPSTTAKRNKQREHHARRIYLKAQHENCFLFLPFILAYSPRSCDSLKLPDVERLRELKPAQVDNSSKVKELIEGILTKTGLSDCPGYLEFMKAFFKVSTNPVSEYKYCKASEEGIAQILDACICQSIRRYIDNDDGRTYAAVTMLFPTDGLVDCIMSLDILPSKVEYLAKTLFDVELRSVGGVRYFPLPKGVTATLGNQIHLKGVSKDNLTRVFGLKLCDEIEGNRTRRQELEMGVQETQLVSMIIAGKSDEGAVINLSIGVKGGFEIFQRIYA